MLELAAQIKADIMTARKARDSNTLRYLSTLYGELEGISKKKNEPISDELTIATIKKFLANLRESEKQTGRIDLLGGIRQEIEVLSKYVPSQMTEGQIQDVIAHLEPANMGEAMKHLKECYGGRYDGKLASQVVRGWLT